MNEGIGRGELRDTGLEEPACLEDAGDFSQSKLGLRLQEIERHIVGGDEDADRPSHAAR
jgi:hypothetical protein